MNNYIYVLFFFNCCSYDNQLRTEYLVQCEADEMAFFNVTFLSLQGEEDCVDSDGRFRYSVPLPIRISACLRVFVIHGSTRIIKYILYYILKLEGNAWYTLLMVRGADTPSPSCYIFPISCYLHCWITLLKMYNKLM